MKPLLPTSLLAACLLSCRAQLVTSQSIEVFQTKNTSLLGVKGNDFSGTIFTKKYSSQLTIFSGMDSTKIFTPTQQEIAEAENLLLSKLKFANRNRPNQVDGNPILDKNLPNYFRQYVGFVDGNGNKVIHINFNWNKFSIADKLSAIAYGSSLGLTYDSEYSIFFDGGSYHWQINANLTKKELTDLWVNGFA